MNIRQQSKRLKKFATGSLVVKGTLILTIAGFATRIIGFYNRIFLTHLIGATELGIYQLIFPLYLVAFSFTTFGNELALTKLISEYQSRGDTKSAIGFFKVCFFINLTLGLLTSTIMYKNAALLCTKVLNAPECTNCLKIISLGIPFMAVKGAIHGYFFGLEQSGVHGTSDLIEQLAKVLGLYILAHFIYIRSSYNAAFAVWGIVIGEFTAMIFSIAALILHYKKEKQSLFSLGRISGIRISTCLRLFFKNSIPLTTNRLALTILQSIESILIPTALLSFCNSSTISLTTYGVFTGMAFPFIMFPSTITNSLSTMLLPAVSSAKSSLHKEYLTQLCEKSIHFCLLIGLFSMAVFYIFGPDIGLCFFKNAEAGKYLLMLSMLCPFIYLATTLTSILNGLGFATHNLVLTGLATAIRISFILFTIPKIGISGYIAGLFVSYLFLTFACLHKLQQEISFKIYFNKSIFFPTILFILTGTISFFFYKRMICYAAGYTVSLLWLIFVIGIYVLLIFLPVSLFTCTDRKFIHYKKHNKE